MHKRGMSKSVLRCRFYCDDGTMIVFVLISFFACPFRLINGYSDIANVESEKCTSTLHGTEWILSVRKDYGWNEDTPRAIITLFMGKGKIRISPEEQELMINELELQLSVALLKNYTTKLSQSDLSLYIQALLIAGRNPRNFKGVDLVLMLENMIHSEATQPLAFLCLCNLKQIASNYVGHIYRNMEHLKNQINDTLGKENLALYLAAYACFEELDNGHTSDETRNLALTLAAQLAKTQNADGSFGNVFTTAIVVYALRAMKSEEWDREEAEQYLRSKMEENLLQIYLIEMALRENLYIKDLAPVTAYYGPPRKYIQQKKARFTIQSINPPKYHSVTLEIPGSEIPMLDFMKLAEAENSNFKFLHSVQNDGPFIYSISGIQNNAEDGFNWKLILEITGDSIYKDHTGRVKMSIYRKEVDKPLNQFVVRENGHLIYSYERF